MQNLDGQVGSVTESWALYATIAWNDGQRVEIDQFDPSVEVVERAEYA